MPIFEYNGKKYNVKDEHIDSFMKDFPDATTIMEREGKKYRVKSADYMTFLSEHGNQQVNVTQQPSAQLAVPNVEEQATPPTEPQDRTVFSAIGVEEMDRDTQRTMDALNSRMETMREYRDSSKLGFGNTTDGKPRFNPGSGKVEKTYITPLGNRYASKVLADMESYRYRQASDMSVSGRLRRAHRKLAELKEKRAEAANIAHKNAQKFNEENITGLGRLFVGGDIYRAQMQSDPATNALDVAIHDTEEHIARLEREQQRENGNEAGFWRGLGSISLSDFDFGFGELNRNLTRMNADKYMGENATDGEREAYSEMMGAQYLREEAEQAYPDNWCYEMGVQTKNMAPFALDFLVFRGTTSLPSVFTKGGTRAATKVIGREVVEKMAKQGFKTYVKNNGIKGFGQYAGNWTIKALGTMGDDLLIRAPLMTNTVQVGKTASNIIDRKLGNVVVNEDGTYDFSNDKTWGSAIWQGEANAIIENYSEMFGAHLDPVVTLGNMGKLANVVGAKRLSAVLSKADAGALSGIMGQTHQLFNKMGVSDYFGEVTEEYYGQLWRTMLNLDDAYQQNPDGTRTNLLATGRFHGDIWGGMALSMGLMGAGKTTLSGAHYAAMKHSVNKADARATELLGKDVWEPLRTSLDLTTNDDMGAMAEAVVNDKDFTDDERAAVLTYMERSMMMRGFNLATFAQSRGEQDEDVQAMNESYIDGYNLQASQEMNDAKNMYDYQRQRVSAIVDEDLLAFMDSNPMNALAEVRGNGLYNNEEIATILDYLNAKHVYDGMIQRVRDDIDGRIDQSNAMVNARTNRTTGLIQGAMMKQDERKVYVIGGNLVQYADGSGIDIEASDNSIIVRDAETGALEQVSPDAVLNIDEALDPITEMQTAADAIRQQYAQEAANRIDGVVTFNPGDTYTITGDDAQIQVQIVANDEGIVDNGDGTVNVSDGTNVFPLAKETIQQQAEAAQLARVAQFEQQRAAENAAYQQAIEEESRPQYALNDLVSLRDENGNAVRGNITTDADADGRYEVYTEAPINGKRVNMFTRDELDSMLMEHNGVVIEQPAENEGNNGGENIPENGNNATQNIPAMQRIPKDMQGNPLYEQTDSDTAWDAIVEQTEGDEAMAQTVADGMVADKEAALNKLEKAKSKGGATIAEKIAAEKERKAAIDAAQQEVNVWKKIAGTANRRKIEEEAERRRIADEAAALRKAEEERLRAEREEAERIEREALNGVPDMVDDTPQDARARGYRRVSGHKIDRQEPLQAVQGKEVAVRFSDDAIAHGRVAVIDATQLQPSHIQGVRNPLHFIDEAQPKERNDEASVMSARKIAGNIRPEEITSSVTAYTGAPTVNARGEAIQGNNRSDALRLMWDTNKEQAALYKQYLIDHAEEFGLNAEDIAAMERPVLVNMIDVDDAEAINLGQFVAQDTESGGTERVKPKNAVQKMGADMRTFASLLLRSNDDEISLSGLIDINAADVLKWMLQKGYITPTQYRSAFDTKGNLTAEAKNDLRGIMYQSIFKGGSTRLEEMFNAMPAKAQKAILATAFRDYDSPNADRMVVEIQNSIRAYYALSQSADFTNAKTFKDARSAVEAWKTQYQIDDATGESYLPAENFSNFALLLAAMYKGQSQSVIQGTFNKLYDLIQGTQEADLFESPDNTPRTLAQAIKEVLNIDYNGQQRSDVLVGDTATSQRGQQGSTGDAATGERIESGERTADSAGGIESGSEQSEINGTPSLLDVVRTLYSKGKDVASKLFQRSFFDVAQTPKFMQELGLRGDKFTIRYGVIARHLGKDSSHTLTERDWEQLPQALQNPFAISKLTDKDDSYRIYTTLQTEGGEFVVVGADVKNAGREIEVNAISTVFGRRNNANLPKNEEVIYRSKEITPEQSSLLERPNFAQYPTEQELSDGKDTTISTTTNKLEEKNAVQSVQEQIHAAEAEVSTNPTEAQKEAGNYKKGHVKIDGFDVTIENPKGSVRRGTDADGKEWQQVMNNTYGYIRGTEGLDGDHIDVFLSDDPSQGYVFVIDQVNKDGSFDEHKVMYGFPDIESARKAYLSNYEDGWTGLGAITPVSKEEFKKWVQRSHRKTKPFAEYKSVKAIGVSNDEAAIPSHHTVQVKASNDMIVPSDIRLRKLKKGETCHVERMYVENGMFDFTGKEKVESADDVAYIFRQLENATVENSFLVLVKDGKPTVIHLAMGSYASTMAPFEQAFVAYSELKPDEVYFVHNHPSGHLKSSQQDRECLRQARKMFGPHVVNPGIIIDTTSGKYGIFEDSIEEQQDMPDQQSDEVPVKVYNFGKQVFSPEWNPKESFKITCSEDVAAFISSHRLGKHKKMSLLVLNQNNNIVSNIFLPFTKLGSIDNVGQAADLMSYYINQCGGVQGVLYGNYKYNTDEQKVLSRIYMRMKELGTPLLDVIHIDQSAYNAGIVYEPEASHVYDRSGNALSSDGQSASLRQQKGSGKGDVSPREVALRDALVDVLRDAGVEVVTDAEEGQRVLDEANGEENIRKDAETTIRNDEKLRKHKFNLIYSPRYAISPVRGEWTKSKIIKRLKDIVGTKTGYSFAARRIAEFDSADELAEHMFYHGTQFGSNRLKPSILMSDSEIERVGGGGYGVKYWGISVSRSKRVASNFSIGRSVSIYPIILVKNAKVKEMPELGDAAELEDCIEDLWKEGVDAVWIGDKNSGEQELCVLNPAAIVNIGNPDIYNMFRLGTSENPLKIIDANGIDKLYQDAKRYVNALETKPKEPKKPSRFLPAKDGETIGEMKSDEQYQQEISEYEQKLDEYKNSDDVKRFEQEDYYARRNIRFFRTRDGHAYGFTVGGKIYIDPRIATAETPIHEYAHLWASAMRELNPKEWKNIVELMNGTAVWDEVKRLYPELKTDDEIADEVLAHYSGRRGAERLRAEQERIAKGEGDVFDKAEAISALERVRDALKRFWKGVADWFGIHFTSAEEVADKVLSDLLNGVNPTLEGVENDIRFSENSEEAEIVARAKADGTYMKAPNGKRSNLSPRQWVQVRTKAFKKWFGDWEKAARIEKLKGSKPILVEFGEKYELNRSIAKQWMKDNLRGEYINNDTGEKIEISKVGIDKVTSHGERNEAHLKSISVIPQMIESSVFIDELPNEKDNDKYDSYRYYVCGLKIDGVDYTAKVVVGVKGDSKYYDHRLTQIEKGTLLDNLNVMANHVAENQSADVSVGKDTKLISILQTNSSKVVDENGEPMVMWHETGNEFSIFDPRQFGAGASDYVTPFGIFLKYSPNPIGVARGGDEKQMALYVNMQNPIEFANREEMEDYLRSNCVGYAQAADRIKNIDAEYGKKIEAAEKAEDDAMIDIYRNHPDVWNDDEKRMEAVEKYSSEVDSILKEWKDTEGSLSAELKETTDQFFRSMGYDGVVLKIDEGSFGRKTKTIIAFLPNQVKSATDNIGTFDQNNPDIRYQFVGEWGAASMDKAEEASVRLDNLAVAREMENAGKDAKAVKLATGWERGGDGKWRYEIEDFDSNGLENIVREDNKKKSRLWEHRKSLLGRKWEMESEIYPDRYFDEFSDEEREQWDSEHSAAIAELNDLRREIERIKKQEESSNIYTDLGTVVGKEHVLFKYYPELEGVVVYITDMSSSVGGNYKPGLITLNRGALYDSSILNHEVQHAIQEIEGFARGGSVRDVRKRIMKRISKLDGVSENAKEMLARQVEYNALASKLGYVYERLMKNGEDWAVRAASDNYWEAMNTLDNDENSTLENAYPKGKNAFEIAKEGFNREKAIEELKRLSDYYASQISSEDMKNIKASEALSGKIDGKSDEELYFALGGEVEARNVQSRLGMTAEERRRSLAIETEDVERKDQIFLEDGLGVSSYDIATETIDANSKSEDINRSDDTMYRIVEDKSTVERLESEPKIKAYRAMQVIDGRLYSPMAAKVDGKLSSDNPFDTWTEAEETAFDFTPEQITAMENLDNSDKQGEVEIIKGKLRYRKDSKKGKGTLQFHLVKGDGTDLWAAYNPYIHSSLMMLNDQFTSAYKRPNIVVVEVEIPESEFTSGYRAKLAKDAVGLTEWKSGPVAGQLPSDMGRKVMLSRWSKVKRIVPYSEVAEHVASVISIAEQKNGKKLYLPIDSFHPELRKELEKRGLEFEYGPYTKEKTDKKGNLIKAWDEKTEEEKQQAYKGAAYIDDAAIEQLNEEFEGKWIRREGVGSSTNDELPQRERQRMVARVENLAKKLHLDNVEIVTDASTLEGNKKRAKGFYSKSTDKITIVIPNHSSAFDVEQTLLHEAVAHYGLRQLFGEHFDTFLDNVFNNADKAIRQRISELAIKKYNFDFRKATEEYLATLAENTEFEAAQRAGWWQKIKDFFLNMLHRIGFEDFGGVTLTDNELRYILWRSYENLAEPGRYRSILGEAADVAKQYELGVGNYSDTNLNQNFAAESDDELYRDGDPETHERALARERYEQRVKSGMYQSQEALQDSMLSVKEAMMSVLGKDKYIEDVDGFENAYLGENRLSSVNKAEADAFAYTLFKPMLDEVAKLARNEAEREELTDYMMAKHGLERNAYMRNEAIKNGATDADQTDYAGLTALTGMDDVADAEAEAQRMVDDYEQAHETTDLWEKVNAVSKAILQKSYDCGMMSKETFNKVSDMYEFYIPLRGFDEKTSAEAYAYLSHKHSAFNAPIKKAEGRRSKADDPFANLQSMAEGAIMQGNRNKLVKQRFLNFALNHPSDLVSVSDIWVEYDAVTDEWKPVFPDNIESTDTPEEVEKKMQDFETKMESLAQQHPDQYKRGKDAIGIPYRIVESRDMRQHQVVVKRGGRDYVITINGNPRAAQALNGQTNPDNDMSGAIGAILRAGEKINRQLRAVYTTRNPDFIVLNFMRDMLYTNTMAWVKESPNYALRFHRNYLMVNPVTMKRLLAKYRNGTLDMSNKTEAMFHQFMMNGGETGYANIRDIEQHKNDIRKELKRANGKLKLARAWSLLSEKLDELNRAVENCARFAAFVTSREMGRSIDRAIYDAKEISVNFNKKGSGAKFYDSVGQTKAGNASALVSGLGRSGYVFWNAAIQGTTNFGRQMKRHPAKAFTGFAVMFLLGAIVAYLGGDDDDDDKNAYYNLPEYVRRSNILFRAGDSWISIPLPIEYRAFYGMGELMTSVLSGKEHLTGGEIAEAIAGQATQILPIDFLEGGGGWNAFVPSAFKPIVEAYVAEKSWTGMPLYKDTPFNKDMPEWTKAYKSANKHIVNLAAVLNEATGGDPYTKGAIDINPAKIEYMLNGYFGGVFSTIDKMSKTAEIITGDREYDPRSILLVNSLVKAGDERTEYRAVNNEYFRLKEEHDRLKKRLRHYEEDTDNGIFDFAEKIDFLYNSPEYERYEIFEDYRKDIDDLNEELNETIDDDERKVIEAELNELKKEMIQEMNTTRKRK